MITKKTKSEPSAAGPILKGGAMEGMRDAPADPSESNALTITVDDVRETIETNSSGVYTVMPSTITVGPNRYGYTLDMYATNGDLVHTNGTEIISGLSQNNGSATTLSTNTWGVALIQPTDKTSAVWRGIPTDQANALRLNDTTDENDNSTTIYYGVVADNSLPDGTYTDSINYVIVAKPAPTYTVVYDANGGTGSMDNQVMGHATDDMLKTVYEHTMRDKEEEFSNIIDAHMEELFKSSRE